MTPKEAFEMLEKCGTNTEQPYEDIILEALYQSLTELKELKKRDTPLQPKVVIDNRGRLDFACLNCSRDVVFKEHHCSHCGQRLDWRK